MKGRMEHGRRGNVVACGVALLSLGLSTGCQWVALTPEAEGIRVLASADGEASGCDHLSNTEVEVPDGAWVFGRREEKVATELETLARNAAAKAGGNAIAPEGPIQAGMRRYRILRCESA